MSESQTPESTPAPEGEADRGQQEQTFTQADVDRIVRERVKREREKFADHDDLKKRAGEAATLEERVADIERQANAAMQRALRAEVANAHGISPEDRDLFLTGTDEETLKAQAERLAARESERTQNGNHVPREGNNPTPSGDPMREFTRSLFSRAQAE